MKDRSKPKPELSDLDKIIDKLAASSLKRIGALPFAINYGAGSLAGYLLWLLRTDARRVTEINIDLCFPNKSKQWRAELVKNSLIETAKTACEMGAVWSKSVDEPLERVISVEGLELIEQAIADKKGVIILAPHLGNWEILGNFIAKRYPMTNLYQPPENEALHKLIYKARTRLQKLAPTTRRGVVQIVKALRAGEITGILPDQEPDRNAGGEFIPFFGVKALTATLAPKLLKDSNAIAVGGFCLRDGNNYRMIFRPVDSGIYSSDPNTACTALNKSVENYILECPEQYQWEYKRFKRRPKGEKKFYNPDRIEH